MDSLESFFNNKKIVITGASGFIGRHLTQRLHGYGARITTISRSKQDFPSNINHQAIDINDAQALENCLSASEAECIFHLAAYKERNNNIQAFRESIQTNLMGSMNLFSAAAELHSLQSLVTLGTAEEYGNIIPPFNERVRECPVTPYSFSKVCVTHMADLFHRLYDIPMVTIRPTLAYGPGQGTDMFLPSLITSLLQNIPFEMTSGEQTRDFIYIDDLVEALLLSSARIRAKGQIINVGSGKPVKLMEIVSTVEALTGKHGLVQLGKKPYRNNEIMDYYADVTKSGDLLGWSAKTQLETGLIKTIAYYRDGMGY